MEAQNGGKDREKTVEWMTNLYQKAKQSWYRAVCRDGFSAGKKIRGFNEEGEDKIIKINY